MQCSEIGCCVLLVTFGLSSCQCVVTKRNHLPMQFATRRSVQWNIFRFGSFLRVRSQHPALRRL